MQNIDETVKIDFKEDSDFYNRFDAGLAAGGGVLYGVGPGNITADLRYQFGLTTITNTSPDSRIKNSVLSISIGYLFPLGSK